METERGVGAVELYRVLLVDDEEDIREGISRKMDWLGLGFSLVGEAANGQDALELAEALRPDVILTDIKMPFMDGLELCRILTDRLPASRFVVFSGFDAFEYAKQAIQMNVVEYILKPINADELSAVLRRLKEELDRERAERRNMELLRSRYTENLPILRELFYTNLLDGHIEPGTERDRAACLDIDLRGEEWAVGLAYIGSDNSRDALSTLSVQNLLEETLTADRCRLSLYNDWVALIVSLTETFTIYDLIRSLDRACTLAASYLGLTLTVGVGAPCRELSGMARSSAEARTALEYRSMVGRGQVIYIGDLEPDGGPILSFEEADERALTAAIKLGNEEEIRQAAAALAGKIRQANPAAGQYHLFLMELVTHLLKMTRRSGVGVEEVFGTDFSLPMQETELPTLAELEDWCAERCLRLHTLIRRRQTDTAGHTVETAKEYIRQHYAESDLSVEKLCAYLHLSSTYFPRCSSGRQAPALPPTSLRCGWRRRPRPSAARRTRRTSSPSGAGTTTPTTSAMCSSGTSGRRPPSTAVRGNNRQRGEPPVEKIASGWKARWKALYHRSGIQMILSIAFTAVAVVGMLFLGIALLLRFSSSANEVAAENSQRVLAQVNWSLDGYLRNMMRVSDTVYYRVIKNADLEQDGMAQELHDALELLYAKDRDVLVSLAVFDESGGLISATPLTELKKA